jgi:hypothetical protein
MVRATSRVKRASVLLTVVVGLAAPAAVLGARNAPGATRTAILAQDASKCSGAAARTVMARDKLGNAGYMPDPVQQVLCGPFLGAKSRAMVVSFAAPTCGGPIGWAVFRPTGDSWTIVMQRPEGGLLQALGSNIKETQNVLRKTDALCDPTGGTRSRIWHYNGSRFIATSWTYSRT